ncbi:MAG: KDO2-lipid IV(A) lauroyltransferase, partial [Cellvibrionaceae bacterium]
MKAPEFKLSLLHPRYWLTWLSLGLSFIVAQLPYSWQMGLGRILGHLFYRFANQRRRIGGTNIELCFPNLSKAERKDLVKENCISYGLTVVEVGMAWFMPYRRLRKLFKVKGQEHWQSIQDRGQGALIIGIHFNTLEICNMIINRDFDMYMSYRPHKNPVFDLVQSWGRQRHNPDSKLLHRRDIRGMVRTMKKGGWLWYAPDQDYGRKVSKFVPWFGIPAATVAATPRLLKMAGVSAVGLMHRRLPGN